jgi:hypothetical protein
MGKSAILRDTTEGGFFSFDIYKRGEILPREFGQSMAKQTNRRSVSGYERGRRRSYSSCPAVSHKANSTVLPVGGWVGYVM